MGHKVLQDHANVFCQMFVGWRMADDLRILSSLPDGTLTFDILNGSGVHEALGAVNLHISSEIAEWFRYRLIEHRIPSADIESAYLHVSFAKTIPATGRRDGVHFDWQCVSEIKTIHRAYQGRLSESHTWL